MRILMLTYEFPSTIDQAVVSGEVKNPFTLVRGLISDGHELVIVNLPFLSRNVQTTSWRQSGEFRILDVPEGRGRAVLSYWNRVRNVRSALRLLVPEEYDVIHAQAPPLALAVATAGKRWSRRPIVVTGHGTNLPEANADAVTKSWRQRLRAWNARLVVPIDRRGFNAAHAAVSVSEFQAVEMAEIYKTERAKITVIHNGVELDRYAQECGRSQDVPSQLLFVGRLAPKKGVLNLLNAMPLILAENPEVRLTIVGGSPLFDFMGRQVHDTIAELGISTSVDIVMSVAEIELPDYYRRSDILIAPSEGYESLPTVILEAMAARLPVVATRSWGTPEALGDDHPGLLSEASPDAIAGAVNSLLSDQGLREQCISSQNSNIAKFDARKYVRDHVALYERTVESLGA